MTSSGRRRPWLRLTAAVLLCLGGPAAFGTTAQAQTSGALGRPAAGTLPTGAAEPAIATPLSITDRGILSLAIEAGERGRWREAINAVRQASDPVYADMIAWMWARNTERDGPPLDTRIALVQARPDWPLIQRVQASAEEQAFEQGRGRSVMEPFLNAHPPVSWAGKALQGEYLIADGNRDAGAVLIREAWIEGSFSQSQESAFLGSFAGILGEDDHIARMDRLLWDNHQRSIERQMSRVPQSYRALARARTVLRNRGSNPDGAVNAVPADLRLDPGLIYERVRWRRRAGFDSSAVQLLMDTGTGPDMAQVGDQKAWWRERAILLRDLVEAGNPRRAYQLAAGHSTADIASLAEAEWMAGWIALRFLNDPNTALPHFVTMFESVGTPISLSRGAYWAGRAEQARGNAAEASGWYRKAAAYPAAFYGQLAIEALGEPLSAHWPTADVVPSAEDYAAVAADSRAQAAAAFAALGRGQELLSFLLALETGHESDGARVLIGDIGLRAGMPGQTVFYARRAALDGTLLLAAGYPMDPALVTAVKAAATAENLEPALIMGLIRQESNFDPDAQSPVGARGLMQLMPNTAKLVSRKLDLTYALPKLTEDPGYNVRLGSDYLGDLMRQFNGSEILSAAGYNAGPGRPVSWVQRNGDPRTARVDSIDWIEKIPFRETRNYVQRVLEGMWVYRQRLGAANADQPPSADM